MDSDLVFYVCNETKEGIAYTQFDIVACFPGRYWDGFPSEKRSPALQAPHFPFRKYPFPLAVSK